MTTKELWHFTKTDRIEDLNFNKVLERFYGLGIAGLTRENIQNSLDGRLRDSERPVVVNIKLGTMKKDQIPGIETVEAHIKALKGRNNYVKNTITHMQASMNKEEVAYISFEDSHTKGLTGAKYGQMNTAEHTWGVYAYQTGAHSEDQDENVEATRGGSHGVGKIASNAASDLHMMFFANCDEDGERHLGGTVHLIEHQFEQTYYRSTGYFTKLDQKKFMPYENDFDPVFAKNTRGLKIVIPFLRESFNNKKEIIQAVCDSFFISILQKKLVVYVNDQKIDDTTIQDFITDDTYYEQEVENMKKVFTPLYVNTYLQQEPHEITIPHEDTMFTFKLYFTYDERIPKGRVGIIRTIGMKIQDFTIKNNATKPFNAVLIGEAREDRYLKSLENESHTEISAKDIKDPKLKRAASAFIRKLGDKIKLIIEEAVRKHNPVDGTIDTADVLYTTEVEFQENLAEAFGTVKTKNGQKTIVSSDNGKKSERDGKESRTSGGDKGTRIAKGGGVRKAGTKMRDGNEAAEDNNPKEVYKISPYRVERLLLDDQELIQLDLSNDSKVKKAKKCNLKFNIIDGMGEEYFGEFDMASNYSEVMDLNTQQPCVVEKATIKGISITGGKLSLKCMLKPSYNRTLKFVYYIEV